MAPEAQEGRRLLSTPEGAPRRAPEGGACLHPCPSPHQPQVGHRAGSRVGVGRKSRHLCARQNHPGLALPQGQVFRTGVPLDPKFEPLRHLFWDRKAKTGDLLEWLSSRVMETQQLQCSDQHRPHGMATVLRLQLLARTRSPWQHQLDSDALLPLCPNYSNRNSALWV